jgi:hypothetical protein
VPEFIRDEQFTYVRCVVTRLQPISLGTRITRDELRQVPFARVSVGQPVVVKCRARRQRRAADPHGGDRWLTRFASGPYRACRRLEGDDPLLGVLAVGARSSEPEPRGSAPTEPLDHGLRSPTATQGALVGRMLAGSVSASISSTSWLDATRHFC